MASASSVYATAILFLYPHTLCQITSIAWITILSWLENAYLRLLFSAGDFGRKVGQTGLDFGVG